MFVLHAFVQNILAVGAWVQLSAVSLSLSGFVQESCCLVAMDLESSSDRAFGYFGQVCFSYSDCFSPYKFR